MKTIKLLLITLLITSCSSDSIELDDCRCEKETFTFEQSITLGVNGLPVLSFNKVVLSNEAVNCQDEQDQVSIGNDIYFSITCDE